MQSVSTVANKFYLEYIARGPKHLPRDQLKIESHIFMKLFSLNECSVGIL